SKLVPGPRRMRRLTVVVARTPVSWAGDATPSSEVTGTLASEPPIFVYHAATQPRVPSYSIKTQFEASLRPSAGTVAPAGISPTCAKFVPGPDRIRRLTVGVTVTVWASAVPACAVI